MNSKQWCVRCGKQGHLSHACPTGKRDWEQSRRILAAFKRGEVKTPFASEAGFPVSKQTLAEDDCYD